MRIIYVDFSQMLKFVSIPLYLLTDAKLVVFMLRDIKNQRKIWWFKIKALTLQQI